MKLLTIAMAFALVFITHTLNAQIAVGNFPTLEQVYKHVDQQLKNPCKECTIQLAKKQDGYYVMFIPYNDFKYEHVEYSKIWDAATNKYLTVDFSKHIDAKVANANYRGHEGMWQQEKESDFNYFYGYLDYTKDLISYLEGKTDLKTNELEMLARAYSSEAIAFIHPNFSGKITTETRNLPEPMYEKVSDERIQSFQQLAEKSIACYQKIKAMSPNYQPLIIKKLDLKLNEDLMDYYLTMKTVKEPEIAKTFFDRIQFNSTEIEAAKSLLNNCKSGGILFVSGDNTTYPLLYVQDKFSFRADVSVINISLLQTPWYFDYIKQTGKSRINIPLETFRELTRISIVADEKTSSAMDFSNWLEEIKKSMKEKPNNGLGQFVESSKKIDLIRKNKKVTIELNTRLEAADVAVLDILSSNPDSPLYADRPAIFQGLNIATMFAQHGAVFEFTGKEEKSYFDDESLVIMKETINRSKIAFNFKTGPIEAWMFQSWCYGLNCISQVDTTGLQQIYAKLKTKLDSKMMVKNNDQSLMIQYKNLMENVSPKDLSAFYRMYSPMVSKGLEKISDKDLLTKENMEILTYLQDLYFPEIDAATGKYTFTQEQKNTLIELQAKVKALMDNSQNQKELSWTYDELVSVNNRFKELGM